MKIGTKIRLIRQHRHMTQLELGERIGLGASGARGKMPTPLHLQSISI